MKGVYSFIYKIRVDANAVYDSYSLPQLQTQLLFVLTVVDSFFPHRIASVIQCRSVYNTNNTVYKISHVIHALSLISDFD